MGDLPLPFEALKLRRRKKQTIFYIKYGLIVWHLRLFDWQNDRLGTKDDGIMTAFVLTLNYREIMIKME